ncbi:MAG TPA: hypothetical protein VFG52_04245 [Xanthomonadales bacterium]|nr:hypothetical protein [Xanthomonadales bacterium]
MLVIANTIHSNDSRQALGARVAAPVSKIKRFSVIAICPNGWESMPILGNSQSTACETGGSEAFWGQSKNPGEVSALVWAMLEMMLALPGQLFIFRLNALIAKHQCRVDGMADFFNVLPRVQRLNFVSVFTLTRNVVRQADFSLMQG